VGKKKKYSRTPKSSSSGGGSDHKSNEASSKREAWIKILEIGGALVFTGLAVGCHDAGYHKWSFFFGYLAVCCGLAIVFHHLETLGLKRAKAGLIAALLFFACLFAFFMFHEPEKPGPHPQFNVSLQIGDSPDDTVFLTNDFLFHENIKKVGELSKGQILVNGLATGTLVIPVQPNESNKVFNFIVQNISPITVEKLQASIGVPNDWQSKLDMNKWQKVDASFEIPGWKLNLTNMQFFSRQTSENLYFKDSFTISITNPCPQTFDTNDLKMGMIMFSLKSTGFEGGIVANTLYLPASPDFSKTFVTDGEIDSGGNWHTKMTDDEFRKSQQ
jgi:hypothetical protein